MASNSTGRDGHLRDLVLEAPDKGWKALWTEFQRPILGRISSFRFSPEDVDEVVQEFSFRLSRENFKLLRGWDPERCSLKGYLCVIATSCCLDFIKSPFYKQKSRFKNPDRIDPEDRDIIDLLEDRGPAPDQRLFQNEILAVVRRSLEDWSEGGRLSPRDRLLLELRLGGTCFDEISTTLGISREAATKQFSRLREELRKRLENRDITMKDIEAVK